MAIKHSYNDGTKRMKTGELTPPKAITEFRKQCLGGAKPTEIEAGTAGTCPLFPFRMGKAHTGRKASPKQKTKAAETARKLHVIDGSRTRKAA
jgi:hypothetical protein